MRGVKDDRGDIVMLEIRIILVITCMISERRR